METLTYRRQANGITKVDMEEFFDDVEIDSLYQWIDRIPLSRPKKNITKDFSDGVLCAEVVKHYFPRDVELHNYTPAAATKQKLENWHVLNQRVFKRLDLELTEDVMRALANGKPNVIEKVLMLLRLQIDKRLERTVFHMSDTPQGVKSPRGQVGEASSRSLSPSRQTRSEPVTSPRKYNKGEIPHGHPDRTLPRYRYLYPYYPFDALSFDIPPYHEGYPYPERYPYSGRSYLADKPFPLIPRPFLPPVSDNVPRSLYEEKEVECQAKDETIKILNAKIYRLQHLLHLKDLRIDDLHSSLQQTVGLGYSNRKR